jgi:hypothetical protein
MNKEEEHLQYLADQHTLKGEAVLPEEPMTRRIHYQKDMTVDQIPVQSDSFSCPRDVAGILFRLWNRQLLLFVGCPADASQPAQQTSYTVTPMINISAPWD